MIRGGKDDGEEVTVPVEAAAPDAMMSVPGETYCLTYYLPYRGLLGADLTGQELDEAELGGAFLQAADLSGATLTGANLRGADLSGVNLAGALYDGATVWPEGFDPLAAGAVEG